MSKPIVLLPHENHHEYIQPKEGIFLLKANLSITNRGSLPLHFSFSEEKVFCLEIGVVGEFEQVPSKPQKFAFSDMDNLFKEKYGAALASEFNRASDTLKAAKKIRKKRAYKKRTKK